MMSRLPDFSPENTLRGVSEMFIKRFNRINVYILSRLVSFFISLLTNLVDDRYTYMYTRN